MRGVADTEGLLKIIGYFYPAQSPNRRIHVCSDGSSTVEDPRPRFADVGLRFGPDELRVTRKAPLLPGCLVEG